MIIYLITNKLNGKIYVGQTKQDLSFYFYQQGWRARNDHSKKPALYSAIKKYGIENFSASVLRRCTSPEEMNVWEKIYITMFSSQNREIGYNIASGGQYFPDKIVPWNKGKKNPYSKDTLHRMGVSQKARMERDGNPTKGIPKSDEQRKKISDTLKAKGIRPSLKACVAGGRISKLRGI